MMKFVFWDEWPRPLQTIFFIFFTLFAASVIYTIVCSILGYQLILDWEVVGQRFPVSVTLEKLEFGAFTIPFQSDNYVVSQWYQGSDLKINLFAVYFFFIITISALILGLTAATFLGRIWFYGLTILFVAALIFFRFDDILLFGLADNTALILMIVSYLGLSYVFYTLRPHYDFIQRLKMFTALTIVWGLLIYFFADVDRPFMMLASNGFLVPFLIGVVFIFGVSHEIIHFIVVALTRTGTPSGNNLTHFSLFSIIYLANVLILYLYDTYVIDWDFYYLNPYVLVCISAVLGLWGLQTRAELFYLDKKMYPVVVFIYLSAALCALGTIFYFLGNVNDSILQVVKDVIIYSHLGFGFIFFIYVISNFMGMLKSNFKVYQVIYKPRNMPHFVFRFAGLILVTAFFLKEDIQISVHQTLSGMFNNLGDYYKTIGDKTNAETYYSNGGLYGYMNHKSNYALARIDISNNENVEALTHYEYSTRVRPSEMAFVNLSNLQMAMGDYFNSFFTLNDGLEIFPRGMAILNNKGYLFSKTNIRDSALLYYDASARAGDKKKASIVNYLALLSTSDYNFDPDSLIDHYGGRRLNAVKTNVLLIRNKRGEITNPVKADLGDSVLNIYSASVRINYLLNQFRFYDSTFLSHSKDLVNRPRNGNYKESVEFAVALASYKRGFVDDAIELLREISSYSKVPEVYNYSIGLILMDMGNFQEAIDYLEIAEAAGYTKAVFARQICQIETGTYHTDSLRSEKGGIFDLDSIGSAKWSRVLTTDQSSFQSLDDEGKYLFIHYNSEDYTAEKVFDFVEAIESEYLKIKSYIGYINLAFRERDFQTAEKCMGKLESFSPDNPLINKQILKARMELAVNHGEMELLEDLLDEVDWLRFDKAWYYKALIAESGGKADEAERYFQVVSQMNSFHEDAILAAADFYSEDADPLKSYNILVEALLQNPGSAKLLKEYIRESYEQGLISYASNASEDLEKLISNQEYEEFLNSLPEIDETGN